jgi:hypothetical protein
MGLAKRAAWALVVIASVTLLIAPALWNGFPLLQFDTGGYLARPFEGYLVPSRSAPYGIFLALGWKLDFWPAVILQALAAVWIVNGVMRAHGCARPSALVVAIAALSALSGLPFLASILLTDIFAGLGVLALYLLVFKGGAFSLPERIALIAFAAFCGSTHSATIAVLAALAGAAALATPFARGVVTLAGARRAIAAVLLGVILTLAGNFAISGKAEWTPGGFGIVFGRLLEDGIVARYLEDHCPDPKLRLCAYRRQLPKTADDFLWSDSVFNELGRFTGMNDEMREIVLGSLRDYPWMHLKTAAAAAMRQLTAVASGEGVVNYIWHTYGIMERFTPQVLPAMRAARQQQGALSLDTLNLWHVPIALISMALVPLMVLRAAFRRVLADADRLAVTLTLAFLANAIVCGTLSNPHPRYGARLAWLATFNALLLMPRGIAHIAARKPTRLRIS